jgi:hypothetical protein
MVESVAFAHAHPLVSLSDAVVPTCLCQEVTPKIPTGLRQSRVVNTFQSFTLSHHDKHVPVEDYSKDEYVLSGAAHHHGEWRDDKRPATTNTGNERIPWAATMPVSESSSRKSGGDESNKKRSYKRKKGSPEEPSSKKSKSSPDVSPPIHKLFLSAKAAKKQSPSSAASASPPVKLAHRLFAPPAAEPEVVEQKSRPPSSQKKAPTKRASFSSVASKRASPLSVEDDSYEEEPIFRGSIAHKVLGRIHRLQPDQLENDDDSITTDIEGDYSVPLKANLIAKSRKSAPVPLKEKDEPPTDASLIRYAVEMPHVSFRSKVLPQERHFREGDRVTVRQGDIQVGTGKSYCLSTEVDPLKLLYLFTDSLTAVNRICN